MQKLEFTSEVSRPGMAIAYRLRSSSKYEIIRVCHRAYCFKAREDWELLPTMVDIPRDQYVMIQNYRSQSTLLRLFVRPPANQTDDINYDTPKTPPTLRLPASLRIRLDTGKQQAARDRSYNANLFANRFEKPWDRKWVLPIKSKITSQFGAQRIPPGGVPYSHTGVDLRAKVGTKVAATSAGIVASCDEQLLGGNVVTIDHGKGVMSRYLHLSKFVVKPGDKVRAGQVIALSGATGRVEAPHLHWEIRVRGYPVDPLSTIQLLTRLASAK